MKRLTPNEIMDKLIRLINTSRYPYKPDSYFFPSDLIPFNASLKRQCQKLYKLGMLDRHGDGTNRWGYSYRVMPPHSNRIISSKKDADELLENK